MDTILTKRAFNKTHVKRSAGTRVIICIVFVLFLLYAFTLVFPFVWMLVNSFKSTENFIGDIWGPPEKFFFSNYSDVLFHYKVGNMNVFGMFGLSILITAAGTILAVLSSSLAAYVIAKYKFVGRNLIFSLAVFIMVVPMVGTLPSQYRIMQTLRLYDNVLGVLVLYSGAFGFNFFMLYGFFKNLSWGYAEAARVDGAGHARIFFGIMLPLAKPALVAVAIIHAINLWNDYTTPSIYLKSVTTLAVGLNNLVSQMTKAKPEYPKAFATMTIALIPILAVFVAFQKTIMENTIAGGLKG